MSGGRAKAARKGAALALTLAAGFSATLGGCSIPIGELPSLGSASDAVRKDTGSSYLPVNQLPPDRDETAMNPKERAKLQAELVAARERQALAAAGKDPDAAAKDQAAGGKDPSQAPK